MTKRELIDLLNLMDEELPIGVEVQGSLSTKILALEDVKYLTGRLSGGRPMAMLTLVPEEIEPDSDTDEDEDEDDINEDYVLECSRCHTRFERCPKCGEDFV